MKLVSKIPAIVASAAAIMLLTPSVSHADEEAVRIRTGLGKCLEIDNSSDENGATAQQWDCGNQFGNFWYIDHLVNETFMIRNRSGKCLEIADSRTDNGAPAQQWNCNRNNDTMVWHIIDNKIYNHNSGKALEVSNSSRANGAKVQQWSDAQVPGQYWYIERY
ncbi:RICIN domain-containing protein [Streptomyces abikoensis]|uniref:RICIN domain-containing protein n=1 Tax=Streptomyces abikoensis TaxID=97398 RepID=UPI00371E8447